MDLYVCLYMSVKNDNIIEETWMIPYQTGKSTKTLIDRSMNECLRNKERVHSGNY